MLEDLAGQSWEGGKIIGGFLGGTSGKEPANAGDVRCIENSDWQLRSFECPEPWPCLLGLPSPCHLLDSTPSCNI